MVQHNPSKLKKAVVVTENDSRLLRGATCIKFYNIMANDVDYDLSKDIILCQMAFLTSNKMKKLNGYDYRFRLEQLRKGHFPWLSTRQIDRILHSLASGKKPYIKITNHNGSRSSYDLLPRGDHLFNTALIEKKCPYIAVYPALIDVLIPKKPSPKAKVAEYDPNHYGATAVQQSIILSRIQQLVGNRKSESYDSDEKDKKFVRSFIDMYNQFFTFMGYSTFLKAIKALENRGLLRVSTVGELELESKYPEQTRVIEINYELLQKTYLPFIKPVVFDYTDEDFKYLPTTSKDISYDLKTVGMIIS